MGLVAFKDERGRILLSKDIRGERLSLSSLL